MKEVKILRIVVASPGDVKAERDTLSGILEELNRGIAADRGLRLELSRWETDTYPGFHPEGPQGLIDPILRIEDSHILIGIFWKRFGTPTKDAKSGTEHEFRLAYEACKQKGSPQIMFYFNQKSYTPKSKEETDQWGRVLEFKEKFPEEGLWWPYKKKSEFEKLIRNHLNNFIIVKYPSKDKIRQLEQNKQFTEKDKAWSSGAEVAGKNAGAIASTESLLARSGSAQAHSVSDISLGRPEDFEASDPQLEEDGYALALKTARRNYPEAPTAEIYRRADMYYYAERPREARIGVSPQRVAA
ncbi:MAG TPA: hypothetical protein VHT73_06205 [Thermodesulfobacteriota bacterium]|nr:hypothetical protein [Thermodesulfobacteriota bacterium]